MIVSHDYIQSAREVLETEATAIIDLSKNIEDEFCQAIKVILESVGRVVVCGMGKSGIVGKKIDVEEQ